MNVLLVEDDNYKANQIEEFLMKNGHDVEIKKSFKSGMGSIIKRDYNLILLDMTIPSFEITPSHPTSRTRKYGGKDILNEMNRLGVMTPVIVITQYSVFGDGEKSLTELNLELKDNYPENYQGYIFYNASILDWQENLRNLFDKVVLEGENND